MTLSPFLAGLILGTLLGIALGLMWERWGQGPNEPAAVDETALDTGMRQLRLEWKDTQERMEHLYDRVRKRARLRDENPAEQPGDASTPDMSKEQLRQIARSKGLM